jgi:hypothetical protein
MPKLLHVLNVRPTINSGKAARAALTAQFRHTSAQTAKEHAVMRCDDRGAFKIL